MLFVKLKTIFLAGVCAFCLTAVSCSTDHAENTNSAVDENSEITLSVATYGRNTCLEESAQLYMSESSNVKIEIITFAPDISADALDPISAYENIIGGQSPENYIKNINTALMGSKGSDLISMDVLSYYQYAESGFLADLNSLMAETGFSKGEFHADMLKAMEYKGGLYMFPTDFTSYLTGINAVLEGEVPANSSGLKISELLAQSCSRINCEPASGRLRLSRSTFFVLLAV